MFVLVASGPLSSQILALLCSFVLSLQALPQEVYILKIVKHLSLEVDCGWVNCNLLIEWCLNNTCTKREGKFQMVS